MGIEEILKLIETVQNTDIQELEVANGDWKVRIARMIPHTGASAVPGAPAPALQSPYPPAPAPSLADPDTATQNGDHTGYVELTSPMVGTFYHAPEPGASPFVHQDDLVTPGQTLCIIEAMKLMNDIPSEIRARVVKILVEDAQPVEYGQPLFLLEPA